MSLTIKIDDCEYNYQSICTGMYETYPPTYGYNIISSADIKHIEWEAVLPFSEHYETKTNIQPTGGKEIKCYINNKELCGITTYFYNGSSGFSRDKISVGKVDFYYNIEKKTIIPYQFEIDDDEIE